MTNGNYDPWSEAEEARELPKTYFGQIYVEAYPVVLEKGVRGGIPFDGAVHRVEDRRTMVHVSITPLPSSNRSEPFEWWYLTFAKEWAGILLPSIKALGFRSPRLISDKYVKYDMAPTGRTYTTDAGEEKMATAPQLIAVYDHVGEAEAAASELYGNGGDNGATAQTEQPTGGMTKDGAYLFLKAFVHETKGDLDALGKKLEANPTIGQFFTVTSPEVIELVGELEKPF